MLLIAAGATAVWLFMTSVFIIALREQDNSIVDIAWGPGFIVNAAVCLAVSGSLSMRQMMVSFLIALWGVRLALHIHTRNQSREGEDFRYRAWRETWGKWFVIRSYGQIFLLQGVVMLVVSAPVFVVNVHPEGTLGLLDVAGIALWVIGFAFEAVGDWQLLRFKRSKRGQGAIMTEGLWSITRHPNYFGEVTLWWGFFLMALGSRYGLYAIISPLTITFLLLRVSGIPMLEKKVVGNPEFEAYKARTSAFFPWFPGKKQADK